MEKGRSFFLSLTLLLLLNLCTVFVAKPLGSKSSTDEESLLVLKAHITSDPYNILANWSKAATLCHWGGVSCSSRHQRVTALRLTNMQLEGTIPPHIGNLSFLSSLYLSNNSFHGHLPHQLAHLHRLKIMYMDQNRLSGSIPTTLFNISSLQRMYLMFNSLSGSLPVDLCYGLPKVEMLELSFNGLSGEIPSSLYKCRMLQILGLSDNQFTGSIPRELGNLTMLKELYLGHNKLIGEIPPEMVNNLVNMERFALETNGLTGRVPPAVFNLSSLKDLVLTNNSLVGTLPSNLCHRLPSLEVLYLHNCKFAGVIPRDIGNCTMLKDLRLGRNNFTGEIPQEIGSLSKLRILRLPLNDLTGPVSPSIFNSSTVKDISLAANHLSGNLPSTLGLWLPNLEGLFLGGNDFSGIIPSSISNASKLAFLELSENSFTSLVPKSLGNLEQLLWLNIADNRLINDPSTQELSFLYSLTNCRRLRTLGIAKNPLNGKLPYTVANLSTSLQLIDASYCKIYGEIPSGISNLSNLIALALSGNNLTGPISELFPRLINLQELFLSENEMQEPIPNNLCSLRNLGDLRLSGNKLFGSIPACLGNLSSLRYLHLSSNSLTSGIPSQMWSLKDLLILNLSSNSLGGYLPQDVGNMKAAIRIDLSKNQLSGDIPGALGDLQNLIALSLAQNSLQGPIPESFGNMLGLEFLDLSNNNLSGEIPKSMEALLYLKYFNVSFNRLQGQIPTGGPFATFTAQSFMWNHGLCGAPWLQVQPCVARAHQGSRKTKVLLYILATTVPTSISVFAFIVVFMRCRRRDATHGRANHTNSLTIPTYRRIPYQELFRATGGFDERNSIGMGSVGKVYKAILSDGIIVAVKVFNLQQLGALSSFDAECEILRSIRHRNLIKIISSCSNLDFKALVMEYMPRGSLEFLLYCQEGCLDILQRLNIMMDVALALEYLHYGCPRPVVHCDVKPSNVLLDENMVAHVGDFSIAKLLGEGNSMTQTGTLATIGYMAPEYGYGGIVSTSGDVYSYGIMLMETFTRKKPTDEMFTEEMSLRHWINVSLTASITEAMDPDLLKEDLAAADDDQENCLSSVMRLALDCSEESPEKRPNMKVVVLTLTKIKEKFLKDASVKGFNI